MDRNGNPNHVRHPGIHGPGKLWTCNGETAAIRPYPCIVCCQKRPPGQHGFDQPRNEFQLWYSVPLDKGSGKPDWKKVSRLDNRSYADTKAECWNLYLSQVERQLVNVRNRISKLENELK